MQETTGLSPQNGESGGDPRSLVAAAAHEGTTELREVQNCKERVLLPGLARKLAKAACLTSVLMRPLAEMVNSISNAYDLVEIACSPTSNLTTTFEQASYQCLRVNFKTGFNLETKAGTTALRQALHASPARLAWVSLPCTRLSSLQNLTLRDEQQMARFLKKRGQDLRRAFEVAESLEEVLAAGGDIAWEWPTSAAAGWRSKAIDKVQQLIKRYGKSLFYCRLDGCQYGLQWNGTAVRKRWTVLTTSRDLWLTLNKRCSEDHEHVECRGAAAQASAYYPAAMCREVLKAFHYAWTTSDLGMVRDAEVHLLHVPEEAQIEVADNVQPRGEQVFVLSRRKILEAAPTGRRLEQVKQQMMRVHRASGHSGFSNLQRLLEARGSPQWAIQLAGSLECPECREASKPRPSPPASLGEEPALFEVLGTDVFEIEDEKAKKKYKVQLWRDRASGLTMLDLLQVYESRLSWEPKTQDVVRSLSRWMARHPTPTWILSDSARCFTSLEFVEFCGRSGLGHTVAPAEAHWVMGAEESTIRVVKQTVEKVRNEYSQYDLEMILDLTANAINSHVGPSGYSAYQWCHGRDYFNDPELPLGLDPGKAMGGLLKARERIKIAYEKERAKDKFSKLSNAVTRPPGHFKTGQLVMLWRQKVKPGKVKGNWIGPLRVILAEGSTIWMATGSSLVRAKVNQIRPVTKREELAASVEGTAVIKTPITVETLLRSFQGRYYLDMSGDVPSEARLMGNLAPTEVVVAPETSGGKSDTWRIDHDGDQRTLVRIHNLPRLQLFSPTKLVSCPVPEHEFTGDRVTRVRSLLGADEVEIRDSLDVVKSLQERWVGETKFPLVSENRPVKVRRGVPVQGTKRKAESHAEERPADDPAPEAEQQGTSGDLIPKTSLEEALRRGGADAVDGLPATVRGAAGSHECPVPGCTLPGGHAGPHEGVEGRFLYDPYSGKTMAVDTQDPAVPTSSSSAASSSSDEMLTEEQIHLVNKQKVVDKVTPATATDDSCFYALEMDISREEGEWLSKHPRKAVIWLSKKMESKSKEETWSKLPLAKKKEFDLAQAKELSQVMTSKALRSLTRSEELSLDRSKVMAMRWVLTFKSSGVAKARLVVLGFQAHNLTEVETASPTMSKLGRNLLLTATAARRFVLKSGDVSSAFLQADASLEAEGLTVWAPPELAVLYGGDPKEPKALRVMKAFYGLVHAPRKWFESVVRTMTSTGWRQLLGDKCVFVLFEATAEGQPYDYADSTGYYQVVGFAGIHVDDFLISGRADSPTYRKAEEELQKAYRFGKWDLASEGFEFAGCYVKQQKDYSVTLDQKDYTMRWLEEIDIGKSRSDKETLTPAEISELRGVLGVLSWRSTQSAPQFLADTSLFLSEVKAATIGTLRRVNKLVREVRRTAEHSLLFPSWGCELKELAAVTWADASSRNRVDGSSSVGIMTGIVPKGFLSGEEFQVAIVQWKSGKTPRQCLGSNGAEVQAITIGEDQNFQVRAFLREMTGTVFTRENLKDEVSLTAGALVMDSRGIYDAMTRNLSSLHGLRESRAGYELTLAVNQARGVGTKLRWVNGMAQLADALTKADNRKGFLQFLSQRQFWRLVHDEKFVAGRKLHKRDLEKRLNEYEACFVAALRDLAEKYKWPWCEPSVSPETLLG